MVKVPFLVCDSLHIDSLPSTQFIYLEVSIVLVRDRFIEHADGIEVPILDAANKNVIEAVPRTRHQPKESSKVIRNQTKYVSLNIS